VVRYLKVVFAATLLLLLSSVVFAQSEDPPAEIPQATEDYSNKLILLPIVYYTPETKLAGGLLFIKNLWKEKEGYTSNLLGTSSITINNQVLTSITPKFYFDKGTWELNGTLFYSYFPNKYYGRGANNSASNPEPYIENSFLLAVGGGKNIYSSFFVRAGLAEDFRKIIKYENGGMIQNEIQFEAQSLEVTSLNMSLEWDRRDYPQAPREGTWYRIVQTFYTPHDRETNKDLQTFRKIDFDFRQYFWLAPRWGLAAQVLASEVQGEQIPFQYLNSLGGGSRLRGYYSGQYRDKALGLLQTELRYDWTPKWVSTVFAGVARMATRMSDLNSAGSLYSGGFGVNYILDPENRTKLRLDFGFTGKDMGAYFLIGEAF
jgi:outer membrane protein assembly factor BamA